MKCNNKTASCNDETCPLTKCLLLKRIHPLKNEQKMLHSPIFKVECENDLPFLKYKTKTQELQAQQNYYFSFFLFYSSLRL